MKHLVRGPASRRCPRGRAAPSAWFTVTASCRRCSCTAGCWSAEGWRRAPAAPRAATGERVARRAAGRTLLVCGAGCSRAAPSASTGRARAPDARAALLPVPLRTSVYTQNTALRLHLCCGCRQTPRPLAEILDPRVGRGRPAVSRWGCIPRPKATPHGPPRAAHRCPPFLFYNKTPTGCSRTTKSRSGV